MHTKGDWQACGYDRGGCACGMIWSVAADCLILTLAHENHEDVATPEGAERTANMRLVVGAPKMLAELRKMVGECPVCGGTGVLQEGKQAWDCSEATEPDCAFCAAARALIAYIDGEGAAP